MGRAPVGAHPASALCRYAESFAFNLVGEKLPTLRMAHLSQLGILSHADQKAVRRSFDTAPRLLGRAEVRRGVRPFGMEPLGPRADHG